MIKVVCGIIYNKDKIFLCRRNSTKQLGGFWEFPGGKLEKNEKPEDALQRELLEEIAMEVKVNNHYITVKHAYKDFEIELSAYLCDFVDAKYELTDHDAYVWSDLNDIQHKKLAPADVPILNKLLNTK